jgi:hypothetical protein
VTVLSAAAAAADAPVPAPAVLPPVGGVAHYRVTRTSEPATGPRTDVSDITLRRKTPTTVTLSGVSGDPASDLTVLNVGTDGSLQIPSNDTAATQDAALGGVVDGLNRAIALFAGETSLSPDGWTPTLPVSGAHGSSGTATVPLTVQTANGTDASFRGSGDLTVQPQSESGGGRRGGGGRHGGFRGGFGFPGGGGGGGGGDRGGAGDGGGGGGGEPGGAGGPMGRGRLNVAVSVDGSVRHGSIAKLSIVETRSVTIDDLPYRNVSGWTIEALR